MLNSCHEYLPSAWSSSPSKSPPSPWAPVHGAFVHNEAQSTIRQSLCYECFVERQTKTINCTSKSIMVMKAGLWCGKRYHFTSLICSSNFCISLSKRLTGLYSVPFACRCVGLSTFCKHDIVLLSWNHTSYWID